MKRPIRRTRRGVTLHLESAERRLIGDLLDGLEQAIEHDDPVTKRLFPTAYADDPEREAAYQILARSELTDKRLEAIGTVRDGLQRDVLTDEEIPAWMQAINSIRLALGTRLDVAEDQDEPDDPDHPDAPGFAVYSYLGYLLESLIRAQ